MSRPKRRVHSSWVIAIICCLVIFTDVAIGLIYHPHVKSKTTVSSSGQHIRDSLSGYIHRSIPEPEATLGTGFLIGDKGNLPADLTEQLRLLGLAHIIVASGYNLTILVRLARRLFARFSKYLAALASTTTIIGFITITGASPSMIRAGIVTGFSLLAWYYGRKIHPLVILPLAAAITLIIKPAYGWGDVGWALSFAAFAGVLVLAPLIQNYFWGTQRSGAIRQIFVETLSAQLLTLPIIAFVFGQYSPLALISNLLILPFVPLAMLLVALAGIGGLTGITALGLPAFAVLRYMTTVANYLSSLPYADGSIQFSRAMLIGSYLLITGTAIYLWRHTKHNFLDDNSIV